MEKSQSHGCSRIRLFCAFIAAQILYSQPREPFLDLAALATGYSVPILLGIALGAGTLLSVFRGCYRWYVTSHWMGVSRRWQRLAMA